MSAFSIIDNLINGFKQNTKETFEALSKRNDTVVDDATDLADLHAKSKDVYDMDNSVLEDVSKTTDEYKQISGQQNSIAEEEINALGNFSNTKKGDVIEARNEATKFYGDLDSSLFNGYSRLESDDLKKTIDDAFRTGIDADILDDMINNGAKSSFDKIKFKDELLNAIDDVDLDIGRQVRKSIELLEEQPLDAKVINRAGNREHYLKSIEDLRNDIDIKLTKVLEQNPNKRSQIQQIAVSVYDDAFEKTMTDAIRFNSFLKIDGIYGRDITNKIRSLANRDYDTMHKIFKARNRMDELTKRMIDDPDNLLTKSDMLVSYNPNKYDINGRIKIVPTSKVDELMSTPGVDIKVKPFGKVFNVIDENGHLVPSQRIMIKEFETTEIQGALQYSAIKERGTLTDVTDMRMFTSPDNKYVRLDGDDYRVDEYVAINDRDKAFTIKNDENAYENINRARQKGFTVYNKTLHRYVTREEEFLLKREDDYVQNISRYLAKERGQIAERDTLKLIDSKYTTQITGNNVAEFVSTLRDDVLDHKKLFVGLNQDSFQALKEAGLVSTFTEKYIKVPSSSKTKGRWILKSHAQEMYGFRKFFLTDGDDYVKRMTEEFYDIGVGFMRESVALKNPITLMSNLVSNSSFMVFAGLNPTKVFKTYPEAVNALKEMHHYKSQLAKLELEHGLGVAQDMTEYKAIQEILKDNIAFQSKEAGVLKSLIDDGLWDRVVRENPDMDFGETVIKNIAMTKDSKAGLKVRELTDTVDMMGRITSYKLFREKYIAEGMTPDVASKKASKMTDDLMINYNRLLTPTSMFLRDKGIMPFINWYQRSLPAMHKVFKENPSRVIIMLGVYEAISEVIGEEDQYGADYWGGVRVNSFSHYNTLKLDGLTDPFSFLASDPSTAVPQLYKHMWNSEYDKVLGVNYSSRYNPLVNNSESVNVENN